jgi:WD40 repeat protein
MSFSNGDKLVRELQSPDRSNRCALDSREFHFVSDNKQAPTSEAPSGPEAETIAPSSQPPVLQDGSTQSESPPSGPTFPPIPGYEILSELGRGGMGVVYQARHSQLQREVALKMILAGGHADSADLARFRTEAEAIARLQHPNIVQIHEIGEHEGKPFFSLEFCDGGSLAQKINGTPLPPIEAAQIIETLARAMSYAHQRGVVHRDLKPANVLLVSSGVVSKEESTTHRLPLTTYQLKITDFGLAKKLDEAGQTASGAILGTPSYMAPEQAGGKGKEVGPAADIYALGAILYEFLTGRPPFRAATALDTLLQVVTDDPVPPTQLQSKTPKDLETICLKCLQKEPGKRYASALELAEDLRRFQAGEPILARPIGLLGRATKWVKRRPAIAGLIAVVIAVALAGLGAVLWQLQQTRHALDLADKALEKSETNLYINQIALARRELLAHNLHFADQYLSDCSEAHRGWEWYYLKRQCNPELFVYRGHRANVGEVIFSPDGRYFASRESGDVQKMVKKGWVKDVFEGTVKVWDAATGRELFSLFHARATGMAFSPDSSTLAVNSLGPPIEELLGPDGWGPLTRPVVKILELPAGRQKHSIPLPEQMTGTRIQFSPSGDQLVFWHPNAFNLGAFDLATGKVIWHQNQVAQGVAFLNQGKRLTTFRNETVTHWETATGKKESSSAFPEPVQAISSDGQLVVTAPLNNNEKGGEIRIWRADTGKEIASLKGHSGKIRLSPDRKKLAFEIWKDGKAIIQLWDVKTGTQEIILRAPREFLDFAFSPKGKLIVSSNSDKAVRVWDLSKPGEFQTLARLGKVPIFLAFQPDSDRLVTAAGEFVGAPSEIRLWESNSGKEILSFKPHPLGILSLCLSPDGKQLATAGVNSINEKGVIDQTEIKLWDTATGKELLSGPTHTHLYTIAFRNGGLYFLKQTFDREHGARCDVVFWDPGTGVVRPTPVVKVDGDMVFITPDAGKYVFNKEGAVVLWDTATEKELRRLSLDGLAIAISPDGRRVLVKEREREGEAGRVKAIDIETGKELFTLRDSGKRIHWVAFSPDGRRLVSANWDSTVTIWHGLTGQELLTLSGHGGPVLHVAFSPDGRLLASAGEDRTVKIWNGQPLE